MNIIMATGMSKAWKANINRCRGYLGVMFLSDMSTADGKYLEQFTFDPKENSTRSSYTFPREEPTTADCKRWCSFWANFTTTGRRLTADLGKWLNPTHRTWRWYYNEEKDDLVRLENKVLSHYKLGQSRHTRSKAIWDLTWTKDYMGQYLGRPTSVTASFLEATVTKQEEGPPLAIGSSITTDF